jgi:OOP family OmpA-OmpF porin
MNRYILRTAFLLAALMATLLVLTAGSVLAQGAETRLVPKVDNFILFQDYSGSMALDNEALDAEKIALAKEFLTRLNAKIPDLEYRAAFHSFAPYRVFWPANGLERFDRQAIAQAIPTIAENYEVYGRLTPIGESMQYLDATTLQGATQRTALILLSDGVNNSGDDPVEVAQGLYSRYPNLCIHVVSFATRGDQKGLETLKKISGLNQCSVFADATELLKDEALLDKFVEDVFYDRETVERPAPPAPPVVVAPVVPPVTAEVITFRAVTFAFDSAEIRPEMAPILDEAAEILKERRGSVVLEGHTDSIGTDEYNTSLGRRRAESVKDYLTRQGVPEGSMQTTSLGETQPKYTNETREGRSLNRRVEIRFE